MTAGFLFACFFNAILSFGMLRQGKQWKEWSEKEIKDKVQEQTKELKQQLLETKTELSLAQNKIRELKEKEK